MIRALNGWYLNPDRVRAARPDNGGREDQHTIVEMDDGTEYRVDQREWDRQEKYVASTIVPASPGFLLRNYAGLHKGDPIWDEQIIAWLLPSVGVFTAFSDGDPETEFDMSVIVEPSGKVFRPFCQGWNSWEEALPDLKKSAEEREQRDAVRTAKAIAAREAKPNAQ